MLRSVLAGLRGRLPSPEPGEAWAASREAAPGTRRWFLISFAFLAAGLAAGWLFGRELDGLFAPAVGELSRSAGSLPGLFGSEATLAAFILGKNLSVALLVLAAAPLAERAAAPFAARRGSGTRLARFARRLWMLVAADVVPPAVLVVNGAMLSWAASLFRSTGVSWAAFLAGILPHGVPELTALCLVCAHAMSAPPRLGERLRLAARAALPLFALAAVLEASVSPALMERFL